MKAIAVYGSPEQGRQRRSHVAMGGDNGLVRRPQAYGLAAGRPAGYITMGCFLSGVFVPTSTYRHRCPVSES